MEGRGNRRIHAGRIVRHSDPDSVCIVLDETSDRLFRRCQTIVFECLDAAASNMPAEPPMDLNDEFFIDHFVLKPEPFM